MSNLLRFVDIFSAFPFSAPPPSLPTLFLTSPLPFQPAPPLLQRSKQ